MNTENNSLNDGTNENNGNNGRKDSGRKYVHSTQLLGAILAATGIVDFNKICNKTKGVAFAEYSIVAIKQLLAAARYRGWDLGYKNGQFFGYNGASWWEYDKTAINWLLYSGAMKMGVPWKVLETKFCEMILEHFKVEAIIHPNDDWTSKDHVLVNFENGTYEITTSKRGLREFNSRDNLHYQLPFSYDLNATAPLFNKFLDEVLPDKESQAVLAEFIGYVFTKTLKIEKVLLLYGSGANGKSVFFEVINALLGRYNCSTYTLFSLTDEKGYARAKIANKLVNYCSEISSKMDTELFKMLASGEPIEARLPYQDPCNMEGYAKLIFNCNSLPKEVENNNAFFRRFLIIPFTQTIPEDKQDKELPRKIIASELPGVFNWVMDGLDRLLAQKKFSACSISAEAVEKYRKESDSVQVFLDEFNYTKSDTEYVKQYELHENYAKYCRRAGLMPLGIIKFGQRCEALGIHRKKLNIGMAVYLKTDPFGFTELLKMIRNGDK